ncbi:DUF262 domain-containing protein [Pseudidiomarina sp. GXY010]|uniref:DUF262 domain-containing protein n=1 Tax=Pseudidiomarina fusca TaxID=2965078 RepID=A0ABU3KVA2_9GAMM|nr:DUF262 domain-containing protein [Pseudidiomarina sp. GXY010]MDT7525107.1 DUF262 domain-containing protein [Pseudidiomarina sp. GXY010]
MTVEVLTCTAAEILRGNLIPAGEQAGIKGQLTIPEYQRPYCWQEQQLSQLLTDINAHNQQTPDLSYYLGSLILHHADDKLNIIDGQQRVTTLAMIACLLESGADIELSFAAPESQQQIKHNLAWLRKRMDTLSSLVNLEQLVFTIVVTQSEDDAYLFFETQNTGGVRLGGPDIIKAHHLRAISTTHQERFARTWEGLGKLNKTVDALLKGRYWQALNRRTLPSHQQTQRIRDTIVNELAQETGTGPDVAYGRMRRQLGLSGEVFMQTAQQGYDVRQPLNEGINTIHYLAYFQSLYNRYWQVPDLPHLQEYQSFIEWLQNLKGCGYLQNLYEACLLLYISVFGEEKLEQAAKKLFRVVYSRRVSNQKAVREKSVPAFIKEYPVLDWIAQSYTPQQCFELLDNFELVVDSSNLAKDENSTKKRFIKAVVEHFQLDIQPENYADEFSIALTLAVTEGAQ